MKIALNQKLKDFDGEVLITEKLVGKETKKTPLTIAEVVINSLTANFGDEKDLTGDEKVKRFILAQKIHRKKDGTAEITIDEASMVKKLVGKAYGVLIVGQVFEILEK